MQTEKEKMKMSRSPYIDNVVLTDKHSGKRTHKVQAFVLHIMAAKWTGRRCAEYFRDTPSREASANYCIGYDGDVALNVEEHNRAWTSSSAWADNRALTYELANSETGHPWKVSDKTLNKAIKMLAEHHKRYGLKKCTYTGDTNGTIWRHDWFANTTCPGPYLGGLLNHIAEEVNKILRGEDKPVKPSAPKPTPAPKPESKPSTGKQTLHLPASAKTWRVYKPNGPYVANGSGELSTKLAPSKFGGLSYEIKGSPTSHVYLIDTEQLGRVAIYAHPSTGAVIKGTTPIAKPTPQPNGTSYKEKGTFYPNDTIIVRDAPSTGANIIARYYDGEQVSYHTVHLKNGYVWLQYNRSNGRQGYIPCRTYNNGKYGTLWGRIK